GRDVAGDAHADRAQRGRGSRVPRLRRREGADAAPRARGAPRARRAARPGGGAPRRPPALARRRPRRRPAREEVTGMAAPSPVVFLLDVDNTLIDNDRVAADLKRYLRREVGPERAGLFDAVDGRVLIYIHKERELDDVEGRFPAEHYVLIDDKLRILTAVKERWGDRLTTVFPRQGHYAHAAEVATYPPADITVERIGDLLGYDLPA